MGDLRDLRDLAPEIAREASGEIESAIQSQFVRGVDPYGAEWAQLADSTKKRRPWRNDPPLTDTGAMRASLTVDAFGSSIVTSMNDPAGYHNVGGGDLPKRLIFPDERGLPETWRAGANDAIDRVIHRHLGDTVTIEVDES